MEYTTQLVDLARAASTLADALPGADRRPHGGSLTVVGTGIRAIRQLTIEAVAEMAQAEALFHVIGEPIQEEAISVINPSAETLTIYYGTDVDRSDTYESMIGHILRSVESGKRTVAAFYGHPGVFVYATHESVKRARAGGYPARMLPAVSAEDCLFADLGVDPGDGCHSLEAYDFLFGDHGIDPTVHLIIWQVGALGNQTNGDAGFDPALLMMLTDKLARCYGRRYPVTIYEAPFDPADSARISRVPVDALHEASISLASTLYVPPVPPEILRQRRLRYPAQGTLPVATGPLGSADSRRTAGS